MSAFGGKGFKIASTPPRSTASSMRRAGRPRRAPAPPRSRRCASSRSREFDLPADFTVEGKATIDATVADRGQGVVANVTAKLADAQFTNEAGDIVGGEPEFLAQARVAPRAQDMGLDLAITGTAGQAFLSVVFFDFGKNPLTLRARRAGEVRLGSIRCSSRSSTSPTSRAAARSILAPDVPAFGGDLTVTKLEFPSGVIATYMANVLTSSLLGDLKTSGSLERAVSVRDNGVAALHVVPKDLELKDDKRRCTSRR